MAPQQQHFEGFKGQKYDINALFLALLWLDEADFNCIKSN